MRKKDARRLEYLNSKLQAMEDNARPDIVLGPMKIHQLERRSHAPSSKYETHCLQKPRRKAQHWRKQKEKYAKAVMDFQTTYED